MDSDTDEGPGPAARWRLWRQDDHGNVAVVRDFDDAAEAEAAREEFVSRGHHQHYWVARIEAPE